MPTSKCDNRRWLAPIGSSSDVDCAGDRGSGEQVIHYSAIPA
jgi:hypothetical protein